MFTTQRKLPAMPPFDFQQSLKFLGLFSPTSGEQHTNNQTLTKALRLDGETVAFRVQSAGTTLQCTLYAPIELDPTTQDSIYQRVSLFLSLEDDLLPFYALAENDPAFAPIIQLLYGYHQVKFLTPFENACWAILTARNRMGFARKLKDQIIDLAGSTFRLDDINYPAFPEPTDLLAADPNELMAIVGNLRRVEYLLDAARAFAMVDEQWLREAPYEEAVSWLRHIKGIGEWSASFILIRALGRMERLAVPERQLIEATSRLYGELLTAEDVLRLAQPYGVYQAYWAHYVRAAN